MGGGRLLSSFAIKRTWLYFESCLQVSCYVLGAESCCRRCCCTCWGRWGRAWRGPPAWACFLKNQSIHLQSSSLEWVHTFQQQLIDHWLFIYLGFVLILLIESVAHKFFGGHRHSHFPSQEKLANKFVGVEVSHLLGRIWVECKIEGSGPIVLVQDLFVLDKCWWMLVH